MGERAARISIAIEKSGLSYPELEKLTGVSKSSLQRYATGVTKKIPIECIEKIAEATGTDANVAITGWSDDEYEITITDDDDKVLDTYKINPDTGIGTNEAGEEVNLPQTGMSGAHKALAGLAALMTLTGIALVKKSRKKEEN